MLVKEKSFTSFRAMLGSFQKPNFFLDVAELTDEQMTSLQCLLKQ